MKLKIFLLLALAIVLPAQAQIYSVTIDTSASNIPTSYTTASTSRVLRNIPNVRGILVINGASTMLAIYCGADGTVPSDTSTNNIYAPASGGLAIDQTYLGSTCFVRSTGSAISSGTVTIMLIGG